MDKEYIEKCITEVLIRKGLIEDEKCSKPHISSLPYNNHTTDPEKLAKRKTEIENRISKEESNIKDIQKENDLLEKDINSLDKKLDDSYEKISEHFDSASVNLRESVDLIDDTLDDVTRREGTSQDTREVWGYNNLVDEYDKLTKDLSNLSYDIDKLNDDIEKSYANDTTFNPHLNTVSNIMKKVNRVNNDVEKIYDTNSDLGSGISPTLRHVNSLLENTEQSIRNYTDEKKLNKSMIKTRDNLQGQVDANNKEITNHMNRIKDYENELKKIK